MRIIQTKQQSISNILKYFEISKHTNMYVEIAMYVANKDSTGYTVLNCHADCSEVTLMYGEDVKGRAKGASEGSVINDGREGAAVLGKEVMCGVIYLIKCNTGTRMPINRALLNPF